MANFSIEDDRDTSPLLQPENDEEELHEVAPVPVPVFENSYSHPTSAQQQQQQQHDRNFDNSNMAELRPVQPSSALDQSAFRLPPRDSEQFSHRSSLNASQESLIDGQLQSGLEAQHLSSNSAVPESSRLEDRRMVPHLSQRLSMKRSTRDRSPTRHEMRDSNSILSAVNQLNVRSYIWPLKNKQPSDTQELENLAEEDLATVDISFLEGPENRISHHEDVFPGDRRRKSSSATDVESSLLLHADRTADPESSASRAPGERVGHSIRDYSQQLANEKNMIVSVARSSSAAAAPVVDLSSLEGSDQHALPGATPPNDYSEANDPEKASYYYPTDPEMPNWRPFSMTPPYLIMLIVVSLILAGVQEYLYQRSSYLEFQGKGLIQFNDIAQISDSEFFAWKYLPTMVMVAYGVLWQVTEYNVKRLEPYYQLSQPTGNIASKSLDLDYTTLFSYFVPWKALRNGHWTVFVASIGSILATTAAPSLQNASITSIRNPNCNSGGCKADDEFRQFVHIAPVWSRLVTVCLILVALMTLLLLFQLRRKSGLLSNPKGIAGIASMATKSHILNDFQEMDTATSLDIHKKLRRRRYILYKSSIWQGEYMKYTNERSNEAEQQSYLFGNKKKKTPSPNPIVLRDGPGIAFLIYLTFLVAAIPIVTYTDANTVPSKLPWLPVLLAVIVKQIWNVLEFAVKMLEPFYALSMGYARPENTLTLDYQGTPYGVLPFQALVNRHYLVSLIGIGSILSDVLTVTSSSLSYKDETAKSYMASSSLSTVIVFFLLCSAVLALLRRRHHFVPRPPSTIASILAFIHQSHMLDDFVNTERFSSDQMRTMLIMKNKRYGLGWFRGRDGQVHCGVDEEPMLERYVYGTNYKDAIIQTASWENNLGF